MYWSACELSDAEPSGDRSVFDFQMPACNWHANRSNGVCGGGKTDHHKTWLTCAQPEPPAPGPEATPKEVWRTG